MMVNKELSLRTRYYYSPGGACTWADTHGDCSYIALICALISVIDHGARATRRIANRGRA